MARLILSYIQNQKITCSYLNVFARAEHMLIPDPLSPPLWLIDQNDETEGDMTFCGIGDQRPKAY